ncbi:hypothetical protein, partial [Polyangium sorediatum]
MRRTTKLTLMAFALLSTGTGCEIIAAVDRSQIDQSTGTATGGTGGIGGMGPGSGGMGPGSGGMGPGSGGMGGGGMD